MSTSSVCAFTGFAGAGKSTCAIEHSVLFVVPSASGLHADTNGAVGSPGAKIRIDTYESHSSVTSMQLVAFVPVEPTHDCASPCVTVNFSVIGGGSPHAANARSTSHFIARRSPGPDSPRTAAW